LGGPRAAFFVLIGVAAEATSGPWNGYLQRSTGVEFAAARSAFCALGNGDPMAAWLRLPSRLVDANG